MDQYIILLDALDSILKTAGISSQEINNYIANISD